jgi:lysophospholipase L1-like esterase
MPHMPPSGVSGLDLYARDAKGQWRWAAATKPNKQEMQATLLSGASPGKREYALYLPLYNGTESLEIGVPKGAKFEPLAPRKTKPLVFYGTSITHGACASRPGLVHTAILGRRFDMPVINLGFSGNGRMHKEVGDLMAELDAACYVIDCLPNMNATTVAERCMPLVKQLREARPNTPILLVEDRRFANSWLLLAKAKFHDDNQAALQKAYKQLKANGMKQLYYLSGDLLLGDDAEGTTDGSHPNDLGFLRQADCFEPVLRQLLDLP